SSDVCSSDLDLCAVLPERTWGGGARKRGRDRAADPPRQGCQGHRRFDHLGPGARPGAGHRDHSADRVCTGSAGEIRGPLESRRPGQGRVHRRRCRRGGRDLHGAYASDPHHPQGVVARVDEAQLPDPEAALMRDWRGSAASSRLFIGAPLVAPLWLTAALATLPGCIHLHSGPSSAELAKQSMPHTQLPPQWVAQGTRPESVESGWLRQFNDAELSALASEALTYNSDLQVAQARVEQARNLMEAAGGAMLPTLSALGKTGGKLGGDS